MRGTLAEELLKAFLLGMSEPTATHMVMRYPLDRLAQERAGIVMPGDHMLAEPKTLCCGLDRIVEGPFIDAALQFDEMRLSEDGESLEGFGFPITHNGGPYYMTDTTGKQVERAWFPIDGGRLLMAQTAVYPSLERAKAEGRIPRQDLLDFTEGQEGLLRYISFITLHLGTRPVSVEPVKGRLLVMDMRKINMELAAGDSAMLYVVLEEGADYVCMAIDKSVIPDGQRNYERVYERTLKGHVFGFAGEAGMRRIYSLADFLAQRKGTLLQGINACIVN